MESKMENNIRTTWRCTIFAIIKMFTLFPHNVAAEKSAGDSNCCKNFVPPRRSYINIPLALDQHFDLKYFKY